MIITTDIVCLLGKIFTSLKKKAAKIFISPESETHMRGAVPKLQLHGNAIFFSPLFSPIHHKCNSSFKENIHLLYSYNNQYSAATTGTVFTQNFWTGVSTVLPQAFSKITTFTKKLTRLKKIICIEVNSFAWNHLFMYFIVPNRNTICKYYCDARSQ